MANPLKFPVKISGVLITTPHDGGPEIHEPTVSCCHCGRTWVSKPGSGRKRGWCLLCGAITCGKDECMACVPYEARLENIEASKPEDTPRRIIVPGGFDAAA